MSDQMQLPSTLFLHDDCGCQGREPVVGGRYRSMSRNLLTGEETGWRHFTCITVEPIRHDKVFCRRVLIRGDDGREWRPQLADFWRRYEAVDNVVPLLRPNP